MPLDSEKVELKGAYFGPNFFSFFYSAFNEISSFSFCAYWDWLTSSMSPCVRITGGISDAAYSHIVLYPLWRLLCLIRSGPICYHSTCTLKFKHCLLSYIPDSAQLHIWVLLFRRPGLQAAKDTPDSRLETRSYSGLMFYCTISSVLCIIITVYRMFGVRLVALISFVIFYSSFGMCIHA